VLALQGGAAAWTTTNGMALAKSQELGGLPSRQTQNVPPRPGKAAGVEAVMRQHPGAHRASTQQDSDNLGAARRPLKTSSGVWHANTSDHPTALAAWKGHASCGQGAASGAGNAEEGLKGLGAVAGAGAGWAAHGPSGWSMPGAAEETRAALTQAALEAVRGANPLPLEAAPPVAQAGTRLQPGVPR